MKKIVLAVGSLFLVVLLVVLGYAAYLLRSIDTPEFEKAVLERAKASLGTDVRVAEMDISVFSGVTLRGVTIANPKPFAGSLLTAESFVLRYRLWPLLRGRFEVERLSLEKPVVALAMDAGGAFNYEKLGGAGGAAAGPQPASQGSAPASPIALELKRLTVEDAAIGMQDAAKAVLMKVEDADLDAAFTLAAAGARGSGKVGIATLNLADMMFVRGISSPIEVTKEALRLHPIQGRLAGGEVTGDVRVDLKGFHYTAELDVKRASVDKLLEEAKSAPAVSGSLAAHASFEGSGGLPTMKGEGRAEIADCRVKNARVMSLLSTLLKLPELANPDFDQCLLEFRLAKSRVQTPVLRLIGAQIQLTGSGTMNLETTALDYDMTLALARPLLNKITVPELRSAFKDRGDGFSTIAFRVDGTTAAPRSDLASRIGKAAAGEAVKKGLDRFFGKKK